MRRIHKIIYTPDYSSDLLVTDFIDSMFRDANFHSKGIIDGLCSLQDSHVIVLRAYRYSRRHIPYNDKRSIRKFLDTNPLVKGYLDKHYKTVVFLLQLIHFIVKKKEYCDMLKFIIEKDIDEIINKYKILSVKYDLNKRLIVLYKMRIFIKLCCLFETLDNFADTLKDEIKFLDKIEDLIAAGI